MLSRIKDNIAALVLAIILLPTLPRISKFLIQKLFHLLKLKIMYKELSKDQQSKLFAAHQAWLKNNVAGKRLRLRNTIFHEISFNEFNLSLAEISDCYFKDCEFDYCNFAECDFTKTNFENCHFEFTNFQDTNFEKCVMNNCSAYNIMFQKSNFSEAILEDSSFHGNTNFDECKFKDAYLRRVAFGMHAMLPFSVVEANIDLRTLKLSCNNSTKFKSLFLLNKKLAEEFFDSQK